jgi:radical SAM superfamily enzyme YgiQ (UPF0313 family)
MKILHLYTDQTNSRKVHVTVPKRFTYFWEISNYLKKENTVCSLDAFHPEYSTFYITEKFIKEEPELVVMLVREKNILQSIELANFLKSIRPEVPIIAYGDIVNLLPKFFIKMKLFNAIVTGGDWEVSLRNYILYLGDPRLIPSGGYVKKVDKNYPVKIEDFMWEFPNIVDAPLDFYKTINKKNELCFTVARGCPYNCRFCLSVKTFGIKERRKPFKDTVDFIDKNKKKFDSFKLFAPSFTLDKEWVISFCKLLIKRKIKTKWCATSRINLLDDEEMIKLMAKSGCYKISVGIETINNSSEYLKKTFPKDQIIRIAKMFKENGIVLKGLIMLGVPGQTKEDVKELYELLEQNDIQIRPTSYSPLEELPLKKSLTIDDIRMYDKFTFYNGINGLSKFDYYNLLTNPYSYKNIV